MRDMPKGRQQSEEARERMEATALVRPFLAEFPAWHRRSAFLTAQLLAKTSTTDDRRNIEDEMRSLVERIQAAHENFRQATAQLGRNSRVREVDAAFVQLLANIRPD
jgi:DNA-binding TFAR19-related protein (PDSD5 family)